MQTPLPFGLRSGLLLFFSFFFILLVQAQPSAVFRVHFDMAEHVLTDEATASILEKAGQLEHPEQFRVQLIGHTDRRGSLEYNQALSERRAASVKAALITLGYPAEQIRMEGLAFLDPLSDAGTEAAMARNRRVEVVIETAHWNVESTYYSVPSSQPTEIIYQRSGTKIQIPADAFTYPDGSPVQGEVLVQYREFRDPADFIASRIPMQFDFEGAPAYFNSTGMFEIRAYDPESQALELQADKELSLDFVQTQLAEGTQFWRLDEEQQTWTSGEELVRYNKEGTREVYSGKEMSKLGELPLTWPDENYWASHPDTLAQLQAAYNMIPALLESAGIFDKHAYIPELDFRTFSERYRQYQTSDAYAGTQYVSHLSWRKIYTNKELYNIRFRAGWSKGQQAFYRLEDMSGENEELQAFADYAWKIKDKDLKRLRKITKGAKSKFADIRIKRTKGSRNNWFTVELKYQNHRIKLAARPYTKEGRAVSKTVVRENYLQYRRVLRAREKAFDEKIAANREKAMLLWPCVKLLLPREIKENPERLSAMDDALREDRYGKPRWPGDSFTSREYRWYTNLATGMTFLSNSGPTFREELTTPNPDWRTLLDQYQPEIYGSSDLFINVQTAFDDPVPRIRIRGLGVFNCDVLQRFEDEHELMARFQDEKGHTLDFQRVEVVNHRLNGLLAFNNSKIYLDLAAPNSLIVYGKDGRIFHLSSTEMAKLDLQGKSRFVFQVSDIGDYTGNPAVLRKLLDNG
ncbi:MAG: OmpA family protein [Saprospiraceae bacterium]|nr:OmpA family protein [Lewinella sp.]